MDVNNINAMSDSVEQKEACDQPYRPASLGASRMLLRTGGYMLIEY